MSCFKHVTFSISPLTCPYFVITIPLSILSPKYSDAAFAICHAAFPTETRITLPGNSLFSSALITALSGRTAFIAASIILSATFLIHNSYVSPFRLIFYYIPDFSGFIEIQILKFDICQFLIIMNYCTVVTASVSIIMKILHYLLNL